VLLYDLMSFLQLLCAAGRFQDALPYFACVEPVALFNKDTLQPYLGLFYSAGAEIYRRCDMPSRALDCLRRALAVYRSAPVDVCRDAECVRDMDLWMRVAGLCVSVDRVTDEIEKTESRIKARGDRAEQLPPSVYDVPVPGVAQRTVSSVQLGRRRCMRATPSSCFCHHLSPRLQIPRTQLLKIPAETLLPQPAITLSRVPATKLQMESRDKELEASVVKKCEHYAVMGSTLLLRASPLPSQPVMEMPEGKDVDLPQKRGIVMPELKLRISFVDIPPRQTADSAAPVYAQHL
jgi:hypothetical protein